MKNTDWVVGNSPGMHSVVGNCTGSEALKCGISRVARCFTQHLRLKGPVMWDQHCKPLLHTTPLAEVNKCESLCSMHNDMLHRAQHRKPLLHPLPLAEVSPCELLCCMHNAILPKWHGLQPRRTHGATTSASPAYCVPISLLGPKAHMACGAEKLLLRDQRRTEKPCSADCRELLWSTLHAHACRKNSARRACSAQRPWRERRRCPDRH